LKTTKLKSLTQARIRALPSQRQQGCDRWNCVHRIRHIHSRNLFFNAEAWVHHLTSEFKKVSSQANPRTWGVFKIIAKYLEPQYILVDGRPTGMEDVLDNLLNFESLRVPE
jgi:hypothetical protein